MAHGFGQGTTGKSFMISYPVATDDHGQHLPAVSGLPVPVPSPALGGSGIRTLEFRDQLEAWVNEGGAGDDVAS